MKTNNKRPERLLDALLKLEPEARTRALQSPRFQRLDLLDLLLERSEWIMPRDPLEAGELAWLAAGLGTACRSTVEDLPARNRLVKAFLLTGDARRLAGERELADRAFDGAAFFLTPGGTLAERARVCRSIALFRWQRGRLDEAAALLRQGARLYGDGGEIGEEGSCLALLGILHAQEDEPVRALEPLERARPVLGERRPWLTMRALLCLALCLAEENRFEESRRALDEARRVDPRFTDPEEKARALWLEGRLSARTGCDRAEGLLVTAITRLVTHDRLPEATLAALDLMVLYAETGQSVRVHGLPRRMSDSGPREGMEITVQALRDLLEAMHKGIDPRKAAAVIGAGTRQLFRFLGLKVDALPWV